MAKTRAIRIRGKLPSLKLVPREVMRAAMPRIVKAVTAKAQDEAPRRRGFGSSKSIVSRIKGTVVQEGERGIVKALAPHSHLIHFGVKAHSLAPGTGKRRWNKKRNPHKVLKVFGDPGILRRSARHPGHGANPFLTRGLEKSDRDVDKILKSEGDKALAEAVAKATDVIDMVF